MKILGIDPGITGGFSICDDGVIVEKCVMPMSTWKQKKIRKMTKKDKNPDGRKIKTYIANVKQVDFVKLGHVFDRMVVDKAYIERVHARPEEGVSSSFKFGMSYGSLLALLSYKKIPYTVVSPSVWTKVALDGVPANIEGKDRSIIASGRLFPDVNFIEPNCRKPHLGLVDSSLIAYYGYRKECNDQN